MAVSDGHTECVSIQFTKKNVDINDVKKVLQDYQPQTHALLPSAPKHVSTYFTQMRYFLAHCAFGAE